MRVLFKINPFYTSRRKTVDLIYLCVKISTANISYFIRLFVLDNNTYRTFASIPL